MAARVDLVLFFTGSMSGRRVLGVLAAVMATYLLCSVKFCFPVPVLVVTFAFVKALQIKQSFSLVRVYYIDMLQDFPP